MHLLRRNPILSNYTTLIPLAYRRNSRWCNIRKPSQKIQHFSHKHRLHIAQLVNDFRPQIIHVTHDRHMLSNAINKTGKERKQVRVSTPNHIGFANERQSKQRRKNETQVQNYPPQWTTMRQSGNPDTINFGIPKPFRNNSFVAVVGGDFAVRVMWKSSHNSNIAIVLK